MQARSAHCQIDRIVGCSMSEFGRDAAKAQDPIHAVQAQLVLMTDQQQGVPGGSPGNHVEELSAVGFVQDCQPGGLGRIDEGRAKPPGMRLSVKKRGERADRPAESARGGGSHATENRPSPRRWTGNRDGGSIRRYLRDGMSRTEIECTDRTRSSPQRQRNEAVVR